MFVDVSMVFFSDPGSTPGISTGYKKTGTRVPVLHNVCIQLIIRIGLVSR